MFTKEPAKVRSGVSANGSEMLSGSDVAGHGL
jgi:hypothetical protein